ncbi:hypothetical protein KIW84_064188 [Lathyrus oleraceus]|uniref:Uncharacterized protein n=1 Tax=Pisum sativum TaxID=3888 RepID=A0A9D4WB01_PEA|nr:hypothetical protein KIW84_064188 [Pisum sativum]
MNDPEPPTGVKKPMSMTSLYLDPINIEPNVVADRDNVDKNICVMISQVLGIDPKTNVVPDVSTSLTQPNKNTENPKDNHDVHAPTISLEKSQDKERSEDIINELDKNLVDQPTDIVNIEELNSDDVPIGQRLAPDIAKRLKNRKDQVVGFSNTPSKSVRKKVSVGPTKRWSKVVTPTPKKKSMKMKDVPSESSGVKAGGTDEEEDNEDITVASDEEETNSDED